MKVVEIFESIDGEGLRTGKPVTFIRLAGCNLRCSYCDTTYSFDCRQAQEMSVADIINVCNELGHRRITLTGGEPLIHKDVEKLIAALVQTFEVNVETNGSVDLTPFLKLREKIKNDNLFFTVDYKCLSSGANDSMNPLSFICLNSQKDIVKCVVSNEKDMDNALSFLGSFHNKFDIWFSPVFGKIEPKEIVKYVLDHHREDITVQVQLHKIIWDPDTKGV